MNQLATAGNRTNFRLGGTWRSSRQRAGMFLLGDSAGRVIYSSDAITWKSSTTGLGGMSANSLYALMGTVVASNGVGVARYSRNMVDWPTLPTAPTGTMKGVCKAGFIDSSNPVAHVYHAETMDVLTANAGAPMAGRLNTYLGSPELGLDIFLDGINNIGFYAGGDTCSSYPISGSISAAGHLCLFNGLLIGCNGSNVIAAYFGGSFATAYSVTVASLGLGAAPSFYAASGNGVAIVAGSAAIIAVTWNGTNYKNVDLSALIGANAIVVVLFNGRRFVVGTNTGTVAWSDDGFLWTAASTGFASAIIAGCTSEVNLP